MARKVHRKLRGDGMKRKLTELCSIQYGYPFDSAKFTEDSNYPQLIRIRDVKRGYSETFYLGEYPKEYIVHAGDLLIGMDGEFNIARWKSQNALLNQRVCKISAKEGTDEEYLRFALIGALKEIEDRTSFATVKHLSAKELNKLELDVPCYEEQKNIANIINKIEKIIGARKQQLSALDDLIKARFVEMFGDEKYILPMQNICSIITDGTHQPPKFVSEGIPFIFVSNITGNILTYDAEKFIDQATYDDLIKRTPIEIGDILLSTVGSYGHPAVVKSNKKFLFQRHIAYLKPRKEIVDSDYLYSAILSPDAQMQIEEGVKGIAQKTLNLSEIKKMTIPIPAMNRQKQFAAFVSQINKTKSAIQKSLEKSQLLFDSLMQQYFG